MLRSDSHVVYLTEAPQGIYLVQKEFHDSAASKLNYGFSLQILQAVSQLAQVYTMQTCFAELEVNR